MEYSTAEQAGEGFVTLDVKGASLSVAWSLKTTECAQVFSYSLPHDITCCSDSIVPGIQWHSGDFLLMYAIGLQDGSIILLGITPSHCTITPLPAHDKLNSAVTILVCRQGFVFVGSSLGECALFYTRFSTQNGAEALQCVRMDVSLLTHNPPPLHVTYFTDSGASRPHQSIPTFSTALSPLGCTAQTDPSQHSALYNLLYAYLDDAAATSVLSASSGVPADSQVILVGCSDGTVWWLQTPNCRAVWELGSELVAGLAHEGTLLDTFTRPVQRILLTSMHSAADSANEKELAPCIVVVEQGGFATLLGTRGAGRRCREVWQLPITADLNALVCYKGVFVYVDRSAGRLCAASKEEGSSAAVVGDGAASADNELAVTALTPLTSPRIQSFRIASHIEKGTECGSMLLHTSDNVHYLSLMSDVGAGDAAAVVAHLRKVCGGGDQRHPHNMVPVTVRVVSDSDVSTASYTTHTSHISTGVASTAAGTAQDQELTRIAAQLITTGVRNEEVLRRCVHADLHLLRLTALLQELPTVLVAAEKCVVGPEGTVLTNATGSVEVTYRLRSEPAPTQTSDHSSSDTAGSGTCVYLDLSIHTHTLHAMRALQDRELCVRLQSTLPSTSLHPAVLSTGVRVQLSPLFTSCDGSGNVDRVECEYRTTLHVSGSVRQLCSYRLTMSVVVEEPRDLHNTSTHADCSADSGVESSSVLLAVVDQVIPVAEVLPHVLSAGAHGMLYTFQKMSSGGGAGRSNDSNRDREYSLNVTTSDASSAVTGEAVCRAYESAVRGHTQQVDQRQHSAAYHGRGGNPLQAAFLVGQAGSSASRSVFNVGAGTTSSSKDKRIAHKEKLTLRAQRTHRVLGAAKSVATSSSASRGSTSDADLTSSADTSCVHTLTSSSRGLLATVAADLHDHLLRDGMPVDDSSCEDDFAFKESDALHLVISTQQAMVRAAHLARQSDPLCPTASEDTLLNSADAMWELYGTIRSSEI